MGDDRLRILAVSYDYRPRLGGIATLAYELLHSVALLPQTEVILLAPQMPGAEEFDRHRFFETRRFDMPSSSITAVPTLVRHISREAVYLRPDAILSFLWLPDGIASFLCLPVLKTIGVPYFIFGLGVELLESTRTRKKRVRQAFSPIKKQVFKNAASVFSISNFTSGLLQSQCDLLEEKVHTVYCGVNAEAFFFAPRSGDLIVKHGLQGRRVFLTISRLEDYKGVDRAISALREVIKQHPDVVYLVCGDGPDRSRLESLVRHYRVQNHVIFAGVVPFARLRDYYNLCDCFVLLSRDDWETPNVEGFGLVYLEAAACSKPSIAGRAGGVSDAVTDGQTGWLVNPEDDKAIANAMIEVLDKPSLTAMRGEEARKRVLSGFTWDHMAKKVVEGIRRHVRD
jgi:phosphatidyl-myo-inositol dimannoside synthase